ALAFEYCKKALLMEGHKPEEIKGVTDLASLDQRLLELVKKAGDNAFATAAAYARVGETSKALDNLELAFGGHSMHWLKVLPVFDGLRSESRFTALIHRLHLDA